MTGCEVLVVLEAGSVSSESVAQLSLEALRVAGFLLFPYAAAVGSWYHLAFCRSSLISTPPSQGHVLCLSYSFSSSSKGSPLDLGPSVSNFSVLT